MRHYARGIVAVNPCRTPARADSDAAPAPDSDSDPAADPDSDPDPDSDSDSDPAAVGGGRGPLHNSFAMEERARRIVDWLVDPGVRDLDDSWFFSRLSKRLLDAGLPLWRASTEIRTCQPEVMAREMLWRRGSGTEVTARSDGPGQDGGTAMSLIDGDREVMRSRLEGQRRASTPPFCGALAAEGATDFVIFRLPMARGVATFVWWATDQRGGFSSDDLRVLRAIVPAIGATINMAEGTPSKEWGRASLAFGGIAAGLGSIPLIIGIVSEDDRGPALILGSIAVGIGVTGLVIGGISEAMLPEEDPGIPGEPRPPGGTTMMLRGTF